MATLMHVTLVNETEGHIFSEWREELDERPTFLELQREWGRCVSKMYRDRKDAPPIEVGYVFHSRLPYEDNRGDAKRETYLREAWVELRDQPDEESE